MKASCYRSAISEGHQYWRLVSSGFLHENLLHLGFNMYLLYLLGRMLEPAIGSLRFATIYFTSLIAGSAGALFATSAPSLGASGAIFGLMGAAVVELRARRVGVMRVRHRGADPDQPRSQLHARQHLRGRARRGSDRRRARGSGDPRRPMNVECRRVGLITLPARCAPPRSPVRLRPPARPAAALRSRWRHRPALAVPTRERLRALGRSGSGAPGGGCSRAARRRR